MAKTPLATKAAPIPTRPIPLGRTPVRAPGPGGAKATPPVNPQKVLDTGTGRVHTVATLEAPPPPIATVVPKAKHSSWPRDHREPTQIRPPEADTTSVLAHDSDGKAIPVTSTTVEHKGLVDQFKRDMSLQKISLVPVNTNDYVGEGVITLDLSMIQKLTRVPLAVTSQGGNLVAHPVLQKRHFTSHGR